MLVKKSTILYIDDDPINLEILKEFFLQRYNVITTTSISEAEDILRTQPVKVLISDQRMPEENGIDFIKRINADFPDIIKIILTAYSNQDLAVEAINDAGIFKYILKPWRFEEVKVLLENSLREYDLRFEKKQLLKELQDKNEAIVEAYSKLEINEKKFRNIFTYSNDCMYILNKKKEIIEANNAFLKLIGFTDTNQDLKKVNSIVRKKHKDLIDKTFALNNDSKKNFAEFEFSGDGNEPKILEINSNEICYSNDVFLFSILRDISDRRNLERKIVETIFQTQEEAQSKYAAELHDGLGPLLSTLKMHIQWIANPDNTSNKDKIINHAIQTIDKAIYSVKEIANNLSPHILQRFGLAYAITAYIEHVKETNNVEAIVSSNLNERLKPNIELTLYRIILECINNSMKHAMAKKIIVKFNKLPNLLQINFSDNGIGFNVEKELNEGHGMGLFNIQNRIKHIGGEIKIVSSKNNGTDITISISIV